MKRMLLNTFVAVLMLQAWGLLAPSVAYADMSCPTPVPVTIDIKPGDPVNDIRLGSKGYLPVAVLTTQDFDASQFSPVMAHLNDASIAMDAGCTGASAVRWRYEDANGDRRLDLVFFFNIRDLNLTTSSTAATLMAHGLYQGAEVHISGTDSVQVEK